MHRVLALVAAVLLFGGPAEAVDRVRVGVLKLTSSAPIFVGVEKGFELTFFQAAAPIARALAAGQLDVGATGLTAALFNIVLGGERLVLGGERLWIVADKGREWPGYPLTAIVVQRDLWDAGVRGVRGLKGRRIGVTQLGSTFHYHLGNTLENEGLTLNDVKVVPLQALSAALEALRGRQVDAVLIPQPFPGTAEAQGFGKVLAWAGDVFPWQCCVVFYGKKFAAERGRALAFMKGYVKASRYYYDAVLRRKDGRPQPGPNHDEVVAITAKYTGVTPDVIRVGFPYQDRNGRLLAEDVEKQMAWWVRHGFMKAPIPLREIVDTSFVEAAIDGLDGTVPRP